MEDLSGISGYDVAYQTDWRGGLGLTDPPPFQFVPASEERLAMVVRKNEFTDGNSIVVWFRVNDTAGNKDELRLAVGLDRSRPSVANDEFARETPDEFTSTYVI